MTKSVVRGEGGARAYIMGVMSYMGVLCFVPLMSNSDDEYILFHAKQGLVIWAWSVIAVMALFVPGIGKLFFSTSALAVIIISIVGIVSVLLRKAWKLPIIYTIASKI
jgi:uncharacterized membrane protein